jgi:hypothetical protein
MAMDKLKGKCAPMGVITSCIVEITDEDETLVIAFIPVNAPATTSSGGSSVVVVTTMEGRR